MTGYCHMCRTAITDIAAHIVESHPQLELWPDGRPVVIDATLEPSDFGMPA